MNSQAKTNQDIKIQPLDWDQSQPLNDLESKQLDGIVGGGVSGVSWIFCEGPGAEPQQFVDVGG